MTTVPINHVSFHDFGIWHRIKIFFARVHWAEREGDIVRHYKLYRNQRVLIREIWYRNNG
jgi:hypothetical protein